MGVASVLSGISSSSGTISASSTVGRLCTITGKVPNNRSNVPIIIYPKTWGKLVYDNFTKILIPDESTTVFSDSVGNFTLSLLAPGDLSEPNIYYIIDINGQIITSTSFNYFSTAQDISTITRVFPNPITASMYGQIKTSGYAGIKNAPVSIRIDKACVDLISGVEILPTQVFTTRADQNGIYFVNLIPTNNLVPFGRYYIVQENNSLNYKDVIVPELGGLIDNNIITDEVVGINKYPITSINADISEPSQHITTPTTVYDDLTNIRAELQYMLNQSWNSLQYTFPTLAMIGTNNGYFCINGQLIINNILSLDSIVSPITTITSTTSPLDPIYIKVRPECGLASHLLTDSFATTLYGSISWESGTQTTISGSQVDVYFITGNNGAGQIVSSINPVDTGTAQQWSAIAPYSYVETINSDLGHYVLHIGFSNAALLQTTYKVSYKIRGI